MKNNKTSGKQPSEAGADANGHASSLYARGYSESAEERRQTAVHEAQGKALFQIKEFAQMGFMSVPEATEEAFNRLWRKAFLFEPPSSSQRPLKAVRMRSGNGQ
jgi:hypothetical protein